MILEREEEKNIINREKGGRSLEKKGWAELDYCRNEGKRGRGQEGNEGNPRE